MNQGSTGDVAAGLMMLLVCCSVPGLLGGVFGYILRGRVDQFGLPWALLPGWFKKIWEVATRDD